MAQKYGVLNLTIVDSTGRVAPNTTITIRAVTGGLLPLYQDRDGDVAMGNPATTDEEGFLRAYVRPGRVEITAQSGSLVKTWEDHVVMEDYYPAVTTDDATTARTLSLDDINALISFSSGSAVTVTVPPLVDVAWPDGATIYLYQGGTGKVSVAAGAGVTLRFPTTIAPATGEQYSTIAVRKVDDDVWIVVGQAEAA